MVKKKLTKKQLRKKQERSRENKKLFFCLFFVFFAVVAIIGDNNSTFGNILYNLLFNSFGEYYKFVFSPILFIFSFSLFKKKDLDMNFYRFVGLFFYFTSLTTLIGSLNEKTYKGIFNLYPYLTTLLGKETTLVLFIILLLLSIVMIIKISYFDLINSIGDKAKDISDNIRTDYKGYRVETTDKKNTKKTEKTEKKLSAIQKEKEEIAKMMEDLKQKQEEIKILKNKKQMKLDEMPQKVKIEKKKKGFFSKVEKKEVKKENFLQTKSFDKWEFPNIDLLNDFSEEITYDKDEVFEKELEIQKKLLQFKIQVDMKGYRVGPTVIQYRLKPKDGVKLNKIENLKKDLTLALKARNIRIQAPIPGEGLVGIEAPNENRQVIGLKELIKSRNFNNPKLELPISVGKDVNGGLVVGDLAKMPHLLVAGQTNSGKSVGVNGIIISLLYKFSPNDLKFILIDPKRVELSVYNGIPHLLSPVVTNPDKATNALKWAVAEMLRRYDLATGVRARNLKEYNLKVTKDKKLPYIVIIIDELADLMMSGNKKEVESSIARIAQMARAVGMHLIVATQRPSVDVITGLIKANIPSRIAFTVASQIDSRTIIDRGGAEDLLGRGDMLYYPTGVIDAMRVQGMLVETDEIEAIVRHLKLTINPEDLKSIQDPAILNGKSKLEGSILEGLDGNFEEDPKIIEDAIKIVKEMKKASTSLIQRKLRLGYARAARVLDILEELGIVGPANGSKPREVYLDD